MPKDPSSDNSRTFLEGLGLVVANYPNARMEFDDEEEQLIRVELDGSREGYSESIRDRRGRKIGLMPAEMALEREAAAQTLIKDLERLVDRYLVGVN